MLCIQVMVLTSYMIACALGCRISYCLMQGCFIVSLLQGTVPLKGNVALALHSTARSSRVKHSILALNAHVASECRVVNHSRLVRVLSIVSHSSLGLD